MKLLKIVSTRLYYLKILRTLAKKFKTISKIKIFKQTHKRPQNHYKSHKNNEIWKVGRYKQANNVGVLK